jgi:hypothetical protein
VLVPSLRRECERIERAGGRAEMPLGQMQVNRRYFKISMAEQDLDSAQVSAPASSMCVAKLWRLFRPRNRRHYAGFRTIPGECIFAAFRR